VRYSSLSVRKYISGFDTFIRHRIVAALACKFNPKTILDVGGEGMLKLFLPEIRITTANIKKADIVYPGDKLPVNVNSFDLVVSLDTIEHLPENKRKDFLLELYKVSKKGFIICAPFGTPEHLTYEKDILSSGKLSGESYEYLAEHVEYGLPAPAEVSEMARLFSAQVFYQGDFRKASSSKNGFMVYYGLLVQTFKNMVIDMFWHENKYLRMNYEPCTNRFFLIANKIYDGC
jgi:hypothetical protein